MFWMRLCDSAVQQFMVLVRIESYLIFTARITIYYVYIIRAIYTTINFAANCAIKDLCNCGLENINTYE